MGTATITPNPSSGSHPPLPPELLDYVLGFLHDDRETLERCCLVSTSWIPRTRNYLFSTVDFGSAADLERWKRAFPDTSNSPAHHTHSLFVSCVEVVTVADADEGGWVRAFSRVTRLVVHTFSANFNHPTVSLIPFHGFSPVLKNLRIFSTTLRTSQILDLVSTLPQLEDLSVTSVRDDDDAPCSDASLAAAKPSHPFTGTLDLYLFRGMGTMTRWLLGRPNGLRFRGLALSWTHEEDLQSINALLGGCTTTLETLFVTYGLSGEPGPVPIDLSRATKLRDASFQILLLGVGWIAQALKTITRHHRDFRQISFIMSDVRSLSRVDIRQATTDPAFGQWSELDRLLIEFWDTRSIHLTVSYSTLGEKWMKMDELVKGLLPEMAKRGLIKSEGS